MRRRERLQRLVLVPVTPFRKLSWSLAGFVLLLAALAAGFFGGIYYNQHQVDQANAQVGHVSAVLSTQVRAAQEQTAVNAKECSIIQEGARRLQEDNVELLASLSLLEDRVAFFKRMVSPKAADQSVAIEQFELLPGRQPGEVRYRMLITRSANSDAPVQGAIKVLVSGGGRQAELALQSPRFQFRYYQQFSGAWQIPAGMAPERIDIQIRGGGANVDRRYKWEIKNR